MCVWKEGLDYKVSSAPRFMCREQAGSPLLMSVRKKGDLMECANEPLNWIIQEWLRLGPGVESSEARGPGRTQPGSWELLRPFLGEPGWRPSLSLLLVHAADFRGLQGE